MKHQLHLLRSQCAVLSPDGLYYKHVIILMTVACTIKLSTKVAKAKPNLP
jgi:hypothetical protein